LERSYLPHLGGLDDAPSPSALHRCRCRRPGCAKQRTHACRVSSGHRRQAAILSAASHKFDIAIICWTFLPDDQSRLLHDLEIVSPRTRVLVLSCPNTPALLPDAADPSLLLQMVRARIA